MANTILPITCDHMCRLDDAQPGEDVILLNYAGRLLSVRGFDSSGLMVSGEVVEGANLVPYIEAQFADPALGYLHAHYARRGCFAARIDRR